MIKLLLVALEANDQKYTHNPAPAAAKGRHAETTTAERRSWVPAASVEARRQPAIQRLGTRKVLSCEGGADTVQMDR